MKVRSRFARRAALLALAAAVGASLAGAAAPKAAPLPAAIKIFVREPGVYRVTFDELAAAGLAREPLASHRIGLASAGRPVPIWVHGDGDGRFGPGDAIEFVGEHLAGEHSYFNPQSDENVYRLRFDDPAPARMRGLASEGKKAPRAGGAARFERRLHLENDDLLLRFSKAAGEDVELWYWAKLGWADKEAFALPLELPGREPAGAVRLRVSLRGWSWQRPEEHRMPDHRVEVALDGVALGSGEWDGQDELVLDLPAVPAAALASISGGGAHKLTLGVPPRTAEGAKDPIVDVVVLNWVEVSYPSARAAEGEDERLYLAAPGAAQGVLETMAPLVIYGEKGSRVEAQPAGAARPDGSRPYAFPLAAGESWVYAVGAAGLLSPAKLAADRPSDLASTSRQADYIMIAHPSLKDAIEPLAALHRRRGLTVEVVDVDDVYDEFSDGVVSPRALRDFLSHAYHHWARPAPRFVLLVGDASWDPRAAEAGEDRAYVDWAFAPRDGARFRRNRSTSYSDEALRRNRNLIPTGTYLTPQGHAASDNELVAVDGNDRYPDLAIGRLPVVTPEEVAAIVSKTIRYLTEPEAGAWRQRILWITNEDPALQRHSDRLAATLAGQGYESRKVYPGATGASNAMLQQTLRQSFDEGFAVVHFHGHGGRYIWRTGVSDLEKNSDLFTLEDLDRLAPSHRLSVVLSMTCYSAPFDHPTADSIGEKLLRLPDKGAVAVFAASWRNAPLTGYSQAVVEELLREKTVGEALVKAKRRAVTLSLVELYNLLGDPALEMPPRALHGHEAAAP